MPNLFHVIITKSLNFLVLFFYSVAETDFHTKNGVMMLKIQLCITGINYILEYIHIESSYFKLK